MEGTDAFDAVSRVFSFLIYRPMRFFFYMIVVVVFGALTYLIVALVAQVTLWFTAAAVGAWSGDFEAIRGASAARGAVADAGSTANIASWWVGIWERLVFALTLAYAVSYFFTSQVWVYLLLRRASDDTHFADHLEEPRRDRDLRGVEGDLADDGDKLEPTGEELRDDGAGV